MPPWEQQGASVGNPPLAPGLGGARQRQPALGQFDQHITEGDPAQGAPQFDCRDARFRIAMQQLSLLCPGHCLFRRSAIRLPPLFAEFVGEIFCPGL
jgi:hypothetical protein